MELAYGEGIDRLVSYCRLKLDAVMGSGCIPIVVFDGNKLNMKGGIESERATHREEARKKAESLLDQGYTTMAQRKFTEAVDITP